MTNWSDFSPVEEEEKPVDWAAFTPVEEPAEPQPDAQFVSGSRGKMRGGAAPYVAGDDGSAARADVARRDFAAKDPRRVDANVPTILDRPASPDLVAQGDAALARDPSQQISPAGAARQRAAAAPVNAAIAKEGAAKAAAEASRPGVFEGAGTAGDLLVSYGKAFPVAVGFAAGIANLATGGALDAVSDWADRAGRNMDAQKSTEARAAAGELDQILKDPNTSAVTVLGFLASKPSFVAGAIIESMPSLAIGAGGGRAAVGAFNAAAGRLAPAAMASNRAAIQAEIATMRAKMAESGADLANIGMGAGSVFSDESMRGASLADRYNAAITTALGYKAAGKMTGGGAEASLAGGVSRGALSTGLREGGQEYVESISESAGKAVGTGQPFDLGQAGKEAVVDAVAGFGMGAAVGSAQRQAPRVEDMPTTPLAPEQIQAIAAANPKPAADPKALAEEAAAAPMQPLGVAAVAQGSLADMAEQQLGRRTEGGADGLAGPAGVVAGGDAAPGDQPGGGGSDQLDVPGVDAGVGATAAKPAAGGVEAGPLGEVDKSDSALNLAQGLDTFKSKGQALTWAVQNRIAHRVDVMPAPDGKGFVLAPKARQADAATLEGDANEVATINAETAKLGWRNADGSQYTVTPVRDAEAPSWFAPVQRVAEAAFGIRVLPAVGFDGEGVQYGGRAYVNARNTSPGLVIGLTGHESLHWLEVNDPKAAATLRNAIVGTKGKPGLLKGGVVAARMVIENANLTKGEKPMSKAGAVSEILGDINGSMWVDPEFWGKVYELDNGSTMRKVMYQFMRAAAKVVRVATGSRFDVSQYVTDAEAVRNVSAKVWAERAQAPRKALAKASTKAPVESSDAPAQAREASTDWAQFPTEMAGKGVPRSEMPQVKVAKRPALFEHLSAMGITSKRETAAAKDLKPTQAEYSQSKTDSAKDIEPGGDRDVVMVSSDGYVLDGHHRWLAAAQQGKDVKVVRFSAPIDRLMDAVWRFPDTTVSSESGEAEAGAVEISDKRKAKINDAAAAARKWLPGNVVNQAVKLVSGYAETPEAEVPAADRKRLEAVFKPVLERAAQADVGFGEVMDKLGEELGAEIAHPPIKGMKRLVEKMYSDEQGGDGQAQPDWAKDTVRATIIVGSEAEVPRALAALKKAMNVVRVKDRFERPLETGYSDVLINVELPNGMLGEVQINVPSMLVAKELGHLVYEIRRALPPGAEATRARMAEVGVYGSARKILRGEETRASNSASDTSMPSRTTRPQSSSLPDLAQKQVRSGSMTTGISSTSTSLDPGGRDFQSYIEGSPAADGSSDIIRQARAAKVKKSDSKPGVNAEIAPNPDTANADRWRLMSPIERQRVTRTLADRYVPRVMEMAGLKGSLEFVQGGFEGETNPAILFRLTDKSYKERGYPALLNAAKLIGRFLDQKATIAYDENILAGENLSYFVKLTPDRNLTPQEVEGVFSSVYAQFSSAAGFTARDGALVFGNFSDLSPEDFRTGIEASVAQSPINFELSDRTFRSDYIDEGQYASDQPGQADPGGQYVRRWTGDLDSLQARFREDLQRELIATGQARPRRDSTGLRAGTEDLAKYGIAPGSNRVTVRRLAEALNARAQDVGAFSPYDTSPEAREAMAQSMADEVAFQLENDAGADTGTGVGWYSVNWPAAIIKLAKFYPELRSSKNARSLFTALIAITSNGEKVRQNLSMAMKLYEGYVHDGKTFLEVGIGTKQQESLDKNLAALQDLISRMGVGKASDYLLEELMVKDITDQLKLKGEKFNSGYKVDQKLPRSAMIFGPKLGAFFANLMGRDGYLTMDLWWSRTFNRLRGDLLPQATVGGLANIKQLLGNPEMTDEQAIELAKPFRDAYAKRNFKGDDKLEKAANMLLKAAEDEINKVPNNASDREFMVSSAQRAREILSDKGTDITVADLQAALWYYEKRLYAELGAKASDAIGYEEAIDEVTKKGGRESRDPAPPSVFAPRQARADGRAEAEASKYAGVADPFAAGYSALEGRKVTLKIRIADTGQIANFTVDAAQYMRDIDERRDTARQLAACIAR